MERITFDNYRPYDAINYSKLKSLSDHPAKVKEKLDWSDGLEFGDALDLLVFTPELFDENYYVADLDNLPSDSIQKIIDYVIDQHGEEVTDETVLAAANTFEYANNWKDSTRLNKILDEGGGARYAQMKLNSQGKHVISIQRHMEFISAVECLKEHQWTKHLLFDDLPNGVERFTQLPLLSYGDPLFKALFDLVIVDHNEKKIYPWDLKNTGYKVENFDYQFIKLNYYLQAALYMHVLWSTVVEAEEGTPVQEFTPLTFHPADYKVENFGFIVVGSSDPSKPMLWQTSDRDLDVGLWGGELRNHKPVKGVFQLAEELKWHQNNDLWDYPAEVYQNNGRMTLDVFR